MAQITFLTHPSMPMWRWAWAEAPAAELARRGVATRCLSGEAAWHAVEPGATVVTTLDHSPALLRHLMAQGPFVAVVNDDLWGDMSAMTKELGLNPELVRQEQRVLLSLVAQAHAVAVTAEPLLKIVGRVHRRVRLVPWAAPPESEWPTLGAPRDGRGVRLGWVGLPPREPDFLVVRHALTRLVRERRDLDVIFWGAAPSWAADLGVRLQFFPAEELGPSEFFSRLAALRLDVVIAPIAPTRLNQSRSQAKFIDAMVGAGCPLVATRFGPYRRLAGAGAPIVTVPSDPETWYAALRDLLDDGARRTALVDAGRAWVAKHAAIDVVADSWISAIKAAEP